MKTIRAITNLLKRYANYSGKLCNTSKYLIYDEAMTQNKHNTLAFVLASIVVPLPFIANFKKKAKNKVLSTHS